MQIERLLAPNPGLFTGPGTNTYVLQDGAAALIVDPGPVEQSHRDAIVDAVAAADPVGILVTHSHPDHAPLANPLGTDNRFHNVGVSARHQNFEALARQALDALADDPSEAKLDELALNTDMSELGRFIVTKNRADIGAFRTPILLNIGVTGPYMHDGSLPTLWDVLDHYNKGGEANPFLDGGMEALALTDEEIDKIVALLFSMTDHRLAEDNAQAFSAQKAAATKERPFKDDDLAMRKTIPFEARVRKSTAGDQ